MFRNKSNEDDYDLSQMIDEYEEDSELRKKIDAMKQAKEAAQPMPETETYDSAFHSEDYEAEKSHTRELPIYNDQVYESSLSEEEADIIDPEPQSDADKTLVIMDHDSRRTFAQQDMEEEEDDSVHLYGDHEVEEEELTEADIEEFLEEKDKEKKPLKTKQPTDTKKMNNIITYVIIGVVAVCLIIGIGFGIKMIMSDGSGGNKIVDKDKDPTTTDKDKDKDKNKGDSEQEKNDDPEDHTIRIAQIKEKIKANSNQIDSYNQQIEAAKQTMNDNSYNANELADKRTKREEADRNYKNLATEIDNYQNQCQNQGEDADDFCEDFDINEKNQELNELNNQWTQLDAEVKALEAKKSAYDAANSSITELNNAIKSLNDENTQLNNELSSLQE